MRRATILLSLAAAGLAVAPAADAALRFERCGGYGFACARLNVPLDRSGALPGQVSLLVKRVRATRRGGATRPPLVVLAGGPGQSATDAFARDALGLLYPAYRNRDIIVFDQRGTGRSGLLRCPRLERGNLLRAGAAAGACARRLGRRRALYTSRDSADDIEAVRAAIGAPRIALFGTSYGTKVALGYAKRFPGRIERLVLDSVVELDGPDPLYLDTLAAVPRALSALCRRRCSWTRDPVADLAALVERIAARGPLRGRVIDPRGQRRTGRLTRTHLFSILLAGDFDPALRATFPGSVRAALGGDVTPLLRLRRRAFAVDAKPPPPRALSSAVYAATTCEEAPLPWQRTAPLAPAERRRQAAEVAAGISDGAFEPFDRATSLASDTLALCERWPHAPVAPGFGGGPLPDVPALLVAGEDDLRTPVENAERAAGSFPRSRVVVAPATGHSAIGSDFGGCAGRAFARFVQGRPVPARCPRTRRAFPPSPPPPRRLADVRRLRGTSGVRGRTLAAVGLTLRDVEEDWLTQLIFGDAAIARGGGLRSGRYLVDWTDTLVLRGVAFVPGVRLSGHVERFSSRRQRGRLRVSGRAGARGRLSLRGQLVRGRLGGRRMRAKLNARPAAAAAAARLERRPLARGR